MKHNNVLPNGHFHKHWRRYVKTWFDQPGRKKSRRLARAKKAAKIAPRPISGMLRPVVHCQTLKYNMKLREGRGFTLEELKGAGINPKMARSIGVSVDHRRYNRSEESLQSNIARLKEYKSRLVLLPKKKKGNKNKKEDNVQAVELPSNIVMEGPIIPIVQTKDTEVMRDAIGENTASAYATLREARGAVKLVGIRVKAAAKKSSGF